MWRIRWAKLLLCLISLNDQIGIVLGKFKLLTDKERLALTKAIEWFENEKPSK